MNTALSLVRAMSGFLLGTLAVLTPFILVITFAVLHANVSHGAPTDEDYRFATIAIGVMTVAFGVGAALLGRGRLSDVPLRWAAIAGSAAVASLLIAMMIVGEPLGFGGIFGVAAAAGALAAWGILRARSVPRPVGP